MSKKFLAICFLLFVVQTGYAIGPEWSNCPAGTGKEGIFLKDYSKLRIIPSGESICKPNSEIWTPKAWRDAIQSGIVPINFENPKLLRLAEIKSFQELSKKLEKYEVKFDLEAEEKIKKFIQNKTQNPVIFFSETSDKSAIFVCTSDGEYTSLASDWFRKE